MVLLLLALACVFGGAEGGDTPRARDGAREDTEPTDTEEAAKGSVVRIVTKDVAIETGVDVEVEAPENATFLRVDACYEDGEVICDVWAGNYRAYGDGSITLVPNPWDGALARVTWLVIE
ncbi:MAG: hypothetical protein ACK4YP_10160 [Myxococcota bacterium]